MLKLTDDGAQITLSNQPSSHGDGLFWFGTALLVGAVAVAVAMSILPERLAIAALVLLIIGSFVFNWQRRRKKQQAESQICGGELTIRSGEFIHQAVGSSQHVTLSAGDRLEILDDRLIIFDDNNQIKCQVLGFDSTKEAQVMKAVLQGQQFGKRKVNIKMQSN